MRERELYLHTSNQIESLAERLVEVSLQQPLDGLLEQETVMTLNPGMARWLRFEIAQRLGVSFAWEFPFPGKLFQRLLNGFDSRHSEDGLFDENRARWELFDLLGKLEDKPEFALLKRYCEPGDRRRLQLASRLAWLFDQYLLYRPDAIADWESGRGATDWQAEIWRRLRDRLYPRSKKPAHIARIWRELSSSHPDHIKPDTSEWPSRLSVFGVSSLPPLYLDLLEAVSLFRPVHIFLLQPSDLYWADLKSTKQIARASQRRSSATPEGLLDFEDASFDLGNPLLPSLGKQGQAFLDLILDKDPIHDDGAFSEPNPSTQLGCLQSDLLLLENRTSDQNPQYPFPPYDSTIQIHRSVSARREVEALWDYLIDHFSHHPNAAASDILVMAPDIQDYAGHIESVFSSIDEDGDTIPFSIADQTGPQESTFISGAIEFLDLANKRATAQELIELLQHPITQSAFSFSESDLDQMEFWIRGTGVVWGWNRGHRARFNAFPTDRNTWSEFRSRLAAGIAFRDNDILISENLSPFSEIEGESVELAGKLLEILGILEDLHRDSQRSETIGYWNQRLCSILDRLRPVEEIELNRFYTAIEAVQESLPEQSLVLADGQEAMSCAVKALENATPASGYLSGRVTFCSLKPMRSIPAKVVCLLGMDNDTFPRKLIRAPFDLLAQAPRRGDRNAREEDKQFFLETLLAARERLFISYKGTSPVSDIEREPSIVVSELIDYLEKADPEFSRSEQIVTHKRQSYDPEYFSGKGLYTYSTERAENCRSFLNRVAASISSPASDESLSGPQPETATDDIHLESLLKFFSDPQTHFVKNAVGARFVDPDDAPIEHDTWQEDPLDRYNLHQRFAEAIHCNQPVESLDRSLIAAHKLLPPGHLERLSYEKLREQAVQVESLRKAVAPSIVPELLELRLAIGSHQITGQLPRGFAQERQFFLHPGKWKAKAFIGFWIRHLVANSIQPQGSVVHSLQEPENTVALPPDDNAASTLADLIALYQQGLERPLPFFPQLSWDALEKVKKSSREFDEAQFLSTSESLFAKDTQNTQFRPRYEWKPYGQACFGEVPEFSPRYAAVSLAVWAPYREAVNRKESS